MTLTSVAHAGAPSTDVERFHRSFDEALARQRASVGASYPLYIDGRPTASSLPALASRSPIDTRAVLGTFSAASLEHVDLAVAAARRTHNDWGRRPWRDRVDTLRRAARLIRERQFDLAARMTLEIGKNRMESMMDAEEAASLIEDYCQQVVEADGYIRAIATTLAGESTKSVLRPYGVFACIPPFNYPLAFSTAVSAAALLAGNTVVYKPPEEAPWTGLALCELYRDAGLPAGAFNYISGRSAEMGDGLWRHDGIDGVAFAGSRAAGLRMYAELATGRWVKPCLLEMGGRNAAIVTESADLDAAAEGIAQSAFALQMQKCSATSRVYVDRRVAAPFLERLLERTNAMRVGDPSLRDVSFGPVISRRAVAKYEMAVSQARAEGIVFTGGRRLTDGELAYGYFVAPTVARLPLASNLYRDELFVPILAVGEVAGLEEAIAEANDTDFGLAAGIFTADPEEVARFFDEIEAGVCYVNKRTGATTSAWRAAQPLCGWKGSGSTAKSGSGPYYITQFMREQHRTTIQN